MISSPAIIKTAGGVLSFISGQASRAPKWMQAIGFEWLYRLLREPRRLFPRYAASNLWSLWRLLTIRPRYSRLGDPPSLDGVSGRAFTRLGELAVKSAS